MRALAYFDFRKGPSWHSLPPHTILRSVASWRKRQAGLLAKVSVKKRLQALPAGAVRVSHCPTLHIVCDTFRWCAVSYGQKSIISCRSTPANVLFQHQSYQWSASMAPSCCFPPEATPSGPRRTAATFSHCASRRPIFSIPINTFATDI